MAGKNSKNRTRKKVGSIIYWLLLIAFAGVLILASSVVIQDVKKYLIAYEASQPGPVIEAYMNSLEGGAWAEQINQLAASKAHPFQTNEECAALISSEIGSNLEYQRAGSSSSGGTKYNLYSSADPSKGYYQIGYVMLKQDESKAGSIDIGLLGKFFNAASLCPWMVTESGFDISAFGEMTSVDVTCPESYSVRINGQTVGNEYIVESAIHYDELEEYYAEHPSLPTKVRYEVNDLIFGTLEPEFFDNEGNQVTIPENKLEDCVLKDGARTTYILDDMVRLPLTAEEQENLKLFADSFISPYLNYFGTKNVNVNAGPLRALIVPGCAIDKRMEEFLDGASWIHYFSLEIKSYDFVDAFSLGDGFYAIDVNYDAIAYGEYKNVEQASSLRIVVCAMPEGLRAITAE